MWHAVNKLLNAISTEKDYDRDSLKLIAELCSGGPTVFPDSDRNEVVETYEISEDNNYLPSGNYDDLGSNHIEYRIVHTLGEEGKTQIPTVLYSFQHHTLPGCCGFAVNRWVRCNDDWSRKLQLQALAFRKSVAGCFGFSSLFVSRGASGNNRTGELYAEFEKIFDNGHQTLYGVNV